MAMAPTYPTARQFWNVIYQLGAEYKTIPAFLLGLVEPKTQTVWECGRVELDDHAVRLWRRDPKVDPRPLLVDDLAAAFATHHRRITRQQSTSFGPALVVMVFDDFTPGGFVTHAAPAAFLRVDEDTQNGRLLFRSDDL